MSEQAVHRPGPFKLPNKTHKPHGRHRTNRQIHRESRGKTDAKGLSRKIKRSASRHERRANSKINRAVHRQHLLEQNRNLSRAPILATIISLSEQIDAARVVERLAGSDAEAEVVASERGNITYLK